MCRTGVNELIFLPPFSYEGRPHCYTRTRPRPFQGRLNCSPVLGTNHSNSECFFPKKTGLQVLKALTRARPKWGMTFACCGPVTTTTTVPRRVPTPLTKGNAVLSCLRMYEANTRPILCFWVVASVAWAFGVYQVRAEEINMSDEGFLP